MTRRVFKWTVPVDDQDHPIGSGRVVHVGILNKNHTKVAVWTDEPDAEHVITRSARIFGTGHAVPEGDIHLGTVISDETGLVWHLFAAPTPMQKRIRHVLETIRVDLVQDVTAGEGEDFTGPNVARRLGEISGCIDGVVGAVLKIMEERWPD